MTARDPQQPGDTNPGAAASGEQQPDSPQTSERQPGEPATNDLPHGAAPTLPAAPQFLPPSVTPQTPPRHDASVQERLNPRRNVATAAQEAKQQILERPHPLTPVARLWIALVVLIFSFGRQMLDRLGDIRETVQEKSAWFGLIVLGIAILILLIGVAQWWFTKFIADDSELRIETGFIFQNSKRIAYERIQSIDINQPLAARFIGLAELSIDVGAASHTKLRYLKRSRAATLRDELLARAHGVRPTESMPAASAWTDLSESDEVLVSTRPDRLLLAALLSPQFLIPAAILIVYALVVLIGQLEWFALFAVFPFLGGLYSFIVSRVTSQWNYNLARKPQGIQITRGLTNLRSQSLPTDRIQGLRIAQPVTLRPFGLYRMDVDVLGYAHASDETNETTSNLLMPAGTWQQVLTVIEVIWPGTDLPSLVFQPSPPRSRWLRWFDAQHCSYGRNDSIVASTHGWLTRITELIPHARTQSVQLSQGPLQRRLRLASVEVHNCDGPVNLVLRHLNPADAREQALTQLEASRAARRRESSDRRPDLPPPGSNPETPTQTEAAM